MMHIRYINMPQICQNPIKGVYEILSTHSFFHGLEKKNKKNPHLNNVICNNIVKIYSNGYFSDAFHNKEV